MLKDAHKSPISSEVQLTEVKDHTHKFLEYEAKQVVSRGNGVPYSVTQRSFPGRFFCPRFRETAQPDVLDQDGSYRIFPTQLVSVVDAVGRHSYMP